MNGIKGVIFDVDGVLEYQGIVYPGAIETIQNLKERGKILRYLTNSTLKSRRSCTEKLNRKGFHISVDEVITASYATAMFLQEIKPKSCWVMLEREGLEEFKDFPQDREHPEVIVVGDYRNQFNFENMNHALRLLANGCRLVGMQIELIDSSLGELELNVGSWVGMLERASGVKATVIGKPDPYMFELAMRSMRLGKDEILMVGDRVSSDVVGAKNVGIRSVLLRTGEFRTQELDGNVSPDFILDRIDQILDLV